MDETGSEQFTLFKIYIGEKMKLDYVKKAKLRENWYLRTGLHLFPPSWASSSFCFQHPSGIFKNCFDTGEHVWLLWGFLLFKCKLNNAVYNI